jgi:hypothetical protein
VRIYLCTIRDCTKPQLARTWCENHYRRWRSHGHPLGGKHYRTNCSVEGCTNRHSAKGYCAMHYQRVINHGDPQWQGRQEIDEVVILRAIDGMRPARMTVAEREAAVRRLHRQGLTDRLIGERIGLGASGVWAIRQRLGLPANAAPIRGFSGRAA